MAYETQRVTQVDLLHGRIRIPIDQKQPFPAERARVALRIRGVSFDSVAWNPRLGPDRERSGVLQVGVALRDVVAADERLSVTPGDDVIALT